MTDITRIQMLGRRIEADTETFNKFKAGLETHPEWALEGVDTVIEAVTRLRLFTSVKERLEAAVQNDEDTEKVLDELRVDLQRRVLSSVAYVRQSTSMSSNYVWQMQNAARARLLDPLGGLLA